MLGQFGADVIPVVGVVGRLCDDFTAEHSARGIAAGIMGGASWLNERRRKRGTQDDTVLINRNSSRNVDVALVALLKLMIVAVYCGKDVARNGRTRRNTSRNSRAGFLLLATLSSVIVVAVVVEWMAPKPSHEKIGAPPRRRRRLLLLLLLL